MSSPSLQCPPTAPGTQKVGSSVWFDIGLLTFRFNDLELPATELSLLYDKPQWTRTSWLYMEANRVNQTLSRERIWYTPLSVLLVLLGCLEQVVLEPVKFVALRAGQVEEDADEGDDDTGERRVNDDLRSAHLFSGLP